MYVKPELNGDTLGDSEVEARLANKLHSTNRPRILTTILDIKHLYQLARSRHQYAILYADAYYIALHANLLTVSGGTENKKRELGGFQSREVTR